MEIAEQIRDLFIKEFPSIAQAMEWN